MTNTSIFETTAFATYTLRSTHSVKDASGNTLFFYHTAREANDAAASMNASNDGCCYHAHVDHKVITNH